jgi:hypothetical protein
LENIDSDSLWQDEERGSYATFTLAPNLRVVTKSTTVDKVSKNYSTIIFNARSSFDRSFPATSLSYDVPDPQNLMIGMPEIGPSGQYMYSQIWSIDIKIAGKLVHKKRDPLVADDKTWVTFSHAAKASDGKTNF